MARSVTEVHAVPAYDALRYLAGRPARASAGRIDVPTAVRCLAEIGLSDSEPLARSGRDERGWFVMEDQTIESDMPRIRGWCGEVDVAVRARLAFHADETVKPTAFEQAISQVGFVAPVPFVDWWTPVPALVKVYGRFASVVSWWTRLGIGNKEAVSRASGLVMPVRTTLPVDDRAISVLVGALFSWQPADIPYVQSGLVGIGECIWRRCGVVAIRGMFRMRECAEIAGAWACMRALDEWLTLRSKDAGDEQYSLDSLPPHEGATRLAHAVPYGVDAVTEALATTTLNDPRDVHQALEVALETGQIAAGLRLVDEFLPRLSHFVADRPRGSNAVDVVELAGMLRDASGDVEAGTQMFKRAFEMPAWGGSPFRSLWLRERVGRGPSFFFDRRWSVSTMVR